MRVLITGATGLIGQELCKELLLRNHDLVVVGRDSEESFRQHFTLPCDYYTWDKLDASNVQAVFHLAGESIAGSRWTKNKKASILNSRVRTTEKLAEAFKGKWPEIFIGASAIGYYGDRDDEILTEDSENGVGFLPEVCKNWEDSSIPFQSHSRVVHLRLGVVLDARGGFLQPMEEIFSMNLGGKVGQGNQWFSWIHSKDVIRMMIFALENPLTGTFNAVAPESVTNSEWTKVFAKQLGVSAFFSVPSIMAKLLLGEMSALALHSQKVSSRKIESTGFKFNFKDLSSSLNDLYNWKSRPTERLFEVVQWVPTKKENIFTFFSESRNLEEITPPWLKFKVLNQSTEKITSGTLIDYEISLKGFPMKWRTEIKKWNPPIEFSDDQIKGPYRKWFHTHTFSDLKKGTLLTDRIIYEIPLGRIGHLFAGCYVKKDVSRIFNFRRQCIKNL